MGQGDILCWDFNLINSIWESWPPGYYRHLKWIIEVLEVVDNWSVRVCSWNTSDRWLYVLWKLKSPRVPWRSGNYRNLCDLRYWVQVCTASFLGLIWISYTFDLFAYGWVMWLNSILLPFARTVQYSIPKCTLSWIAFDTLVGCCLQIVPVS